MKKTAIALLMAVAFAPSFAMAEAGDIVVRLRAVDVAPNEDSQLGKTVNAAVGAGTMSQGAELAADNNWIPELDISYYITKNIAAELILALGTKHDVTVRGDSGATVTNQNLGEVNLLPPTLTLQWHFMPGETIDPYVGAGLNYTRMLDRNLKFSQGALAGTKIRIDHDSFGAALQAGVDVNLKDGWLINADVKYAWINTDVETKLGGKWTKIDDLDLDPWVLGIGVGKRF